MEIFAASDLYPGFAYPQGLEKVVELGLVDLDSWFIMEATLASRYAEGMRERYPERQLIPFAKRTDNDDVACFEMGDGQRVHVIHDFADPGWEQRAVYEDFWSWFQEAVELLIEESRSEDQTADV